VARKTAVREDRLNVEIEVDDFRKPLDLRGPAPASSRKKGDDEKGHCGGDDEEGSPTAIL
jgi:hypothetical protein